MEGTAAALLAGALHGLQALVTRDLDLVSNPESEVPVGLHLKQWHDALLLIMDALGKAKALVKRLCDARDRRAAWGFASLLLVAEAVLCAAIIWRVPCKSAKP